MSIELACYCSDDIESLSIKLENIKTTYSYIFNNLYCVSEPIMLTEHKNIKYPEASNVKYRANAEWIASIDFENGAPNTVFSVTALDKGFTVMEPPELAGLLRKYIGDKILILLNDEDPV